MRTGLPGIRPRRLVATALAIVLAVSFVAGTLVFGDTAEAALYDEYARAARNVDIAVTAGPGKRLARSDVDAVRAVAGVGSVDGRMAERLPLLDRAGRLITRLGTPGYGVNVGERPELRGFDVRSGRLPRADGEAALDARTQRDHGFAVGDLITVVASGESRHELRIVGIVAIRGFGGGDTSTVVLGQAELARLTGATGYREVVATVRPDTDPARVRDRIVAPAEGKVRTGARLRHDLAREASGQIGGMLLGIQLFALVALLVAAFVIYNTFTILVAQRMRETALLRCVGAARGQVFRLVMVESAVVGLAGSALGLGVGLAVAFGLGRGLALLDLGLPDGRLVLTGWPILAGLLLGLVVTVVSAIVPAIRATRVPPIAALRVDTSGAPSGRRRRAVRVALAITVAVGGTLLTALGLRMTAAEPAMILVMAGGIGNFLALLMLSPLVVGRLVAALGWLPGRLFGVPARLAVANARRNPGRTAATTATLLIGAALMAGGSTVAATISRTADAQLNAAFPIDYLLTPAFTGGDRAPAIPAPVAARLRDDRDFDLVAPVRQGTATTAGGSVLVGTLDRAAVGTAYRPQVTGGRLADLGPGAAVVSTGSAGAAGRRVGDRLTMTRGDGRTVAVTVAATVRSSNLIGDVVLDGADFATLFPDLAGDSLVLVRAAPGVTARAARDRLDAELVEHPLVRVDDLAEVREERNATVNQFVGVIAALLGFALVIAVVGIANTLSLSVLERTRESALTRALGLTRGQLRATLLVEALLMAAAGALVGTAFGVTYGWLAAEAAFGAVDLLLSVPFGQLSGFLALATAAGLFAAVLPARRAVRVSIVAAMAD